MDQPARERLEKIAGGSIRVNAAQIATWNTLSEAQQLLVLPLISYFTQVSLVDWEKAVQHLHNFADQTLDQMYQNYALVIAQPERLPDAVRRQIFAGWDKLQKRLAKRNRLAEKMSQPGGIAWRLKNEPL